MKRFRNILACIEDSEQDKHLLDHIGPISRAAETQQIHLLHVASEETESALTPESLLSLASEHIRGHGGETITAEVVTGAPLLEILRYAMENEIDLIVMGRQAGGEDDVKHEALMPKRVTRKATCSVLVLPADTQLKADHILVPVRDSECSANALDTACGIAAVAEARVCCLNVFKVSAGYERVGTTLEEHTELLRQGAEKDCQRLLNRIDTKGVRINVVCIPDLYDQPVPIILEEYQKQGADLLVIGARGRSGAAGVLLGKVTEQLILRSAIPVLAVKKKGECIGILRALLELA
jgi:nucleotide-binding universal stress UspA family protein